MTNFNFKSSVLTALALLSGLAMFSQGVCTQFSYYYADITYPNGGEQTDLYTVQLDGANAVLSPIGSLDVGVHIAFNTENGLLYAIDDNTGDISIVDPITGELISTTDVSLNVGKVTTAAFNDENILFLGSENGRIYTVDDLDSDPIEVSIYSEGNDISGGDLTFSESGDLYLASKPQGKFYEVNLPFFANEQLGNVNSQVTGMATLEDGESVIVSSNGNNQFLTYSTNSGFSEAAAYDAILNGESFTLGNGDMTSGCSERSTSIEGCEDFRTYYIHNEQGSNTDILYEVTFNEMGGAMLTELAVIGNDSHMGLGANGFIYLVKGSTLKTFNPFTLGVENEVTITLDGQNLSGFPAVVVGDDGFVYVGKGSNNTIYKIDPTSGEAEVFGTADVSGGDLVFVGDALWLANRAQGRFYEINGDGEFDVDAEEINGVSILPDGNLLIANGNFNGLFEVYEPITGNATGETFQTGLSLWNGDLAGRCFDGNPVFQDCENFQAYYIHRPQNSDDVTLFSVTLSDLGDATLTELRTLDGGSHLGVGPNGLLYIVNGGTGVMTVLDLDTDTEVQLQINEEGDNITGIPAVVVGEDGFVYVGSSDDNTVYKVNPSTGEAEFFGTGDVNGGDLVFAGGALWLANRATATFYEVNGTGEFTVAATEINGVSELPDGNLLISNGDLGSTFDVYEPITGNATGVQYETGLELFNGDLASRCVDGNSVEEGCENFKLFAAASNVGGGSVYEVTLGEGAASVNQLLSGLGDTHIAYDESNGLLYVLNGSGSVAIYDPVADIITPFVNIAMGNMNVNSTYAAVVTADGRFLVGSDSQNTVYEVNPATGAASNPVDAPVNGGDLVQTTDGNVWLINRGQGRFYNITDGVSEFDVDLGGIYGAAVLESGMILAGDNGNLLRVIDPVSQAVTEVSFELPISITAGDLAGGCGDNYIAMEQPTADTNPLLVVAEGATAFTAYPNPTEGISNIRIVAGSTERAVLEIFDMSGRSVVTLLNQDVQEGNTYRMTFDGTLLPNGIYVVKYVTQSETAIEKIMIAR
ncbi:MAG: T9SS type A sorting domain-containing protein [Cryomorphaceae bacterium]